MSASGWLRPASVQLAAVAAKDGATVVAGAAALSSLAFKSEIGTAAVDLEGLGLDGLTLPFVGAMVTIERLVASPELMRNWPIVWQAAVATATPEIRRAATLGGTVAARLPTSDLLTALCATRSVVTVVSADGTLSHLLVSEYLRETVPGIVTEIDLGVPHVGAYRRFANRSGFAPAVAAVAGILQDSTISLWAGAVSSAPFEFNSEQLPDETDLRSDVHATAWYRRRLLAVMSDEVTTLLASSTTETEEH